MRKLLILAPLLLGAPLAAQNCMDRNYGTVVGNGDDVMLPIQSIGFAFPFCGSTYTDVHISTNGFMHLSNAGFPAPGAGDGTSTPVELVSGSPRVCALWSDFNMAAANGANVFINATPAKCTITWDRAITYGSAGPLFNLQAQLFPSGEIKVFYDPSVSNNSTASTLFAAGLTGVSPGLGVTLPAVSDLIVGGSTTDNTLYETWSAAGFDLANNSLHLIPTNPGWVFATTGAPTNCAASTNYGVGCVDQSDTFYELMPAGGFDLANTTISMLRQPNGYLVLNSIPGTLVTPSAGAAIIANLDDTEQAVTLSAPMPVAGGSTASLMVCSNGRIALSPAGNGTAFLPATAAFLAFASTTIAADWHDYNSTIAGSGKILFEEIAGVAYVTWDNVYSHTTTQPNRFQYQFNVATGNCTIVYGTFNTGGNGHLVGYTVGGPSANPLALDVSAALATPLTVFDAAVAGLQLSTTGYPSFGATFTYGIAQVPNLVPLAFLAFGDTQINPGVDLTFLGMTSCSAYTNANLLTISVPVALPAGVGSQALAIPNTPSLAGASLATQALAFSLATPFNLIASNGNLATIGY